MTGEARIVQTLCCDSEACPTVEIFEDEGRTGQNANVADLSQQSGNQLVPTVQEGQLKEVGCGCGCCGCGCV